MGLRIYSLGRADSERSEPEGIQGSTKDEKVKSFYPLYLLVSLKLLYVVAVVALTTGAYAFTHPAEIEVVKEQLLTRGLAASYFDQPQLLQHNAVKATQERLHTQNNKQSSSNPSGSANPPPLARRNRRSASQGWRLCLAIWMVASPE
jgi:hypothetical protein